MKEQDVNQEQLKAAKDIIEKHTIYSMGGSLIPIPVLDLAAVTAIQLDMVRQLSNLYGADYAESSGKTLVGALTGNIFARLGASLFKSIPGIGTLLGGISLLGLSGATTFALGNVYLRHVSEGGSLMNLNPEDYKDYFRQRFEEGKKKAEEWKYQAKGTAKDVEVEFSEEGDKEQPSEGTGEKKNGDPSQDEGKPND